MNADFTLEEMGQPFFWAVRNMVGNSAVYAAKASEIADCIIDQVSLGTVVTQPLEDKGGKKKKKDKDKESSYPIQMETDPRNRCIYAFATILNVNDEEVSRSLGWERWGVGWLYITCASMEWNGTEGMEWNGMEWNGMRQRNS